MAINSSKTPSIRIQSRVFTSIIEALALTGSVHVRQSEAGVPSPAFATQRPADAPFEVPVLEPRRQLFQDRSRQQAAFTLRERAGAPARRGCIATATVAVAAPCTDPRRHGPGQRQRCSRLPRRLYAPNAVVGGIDGPQSVHQGCLELGHSLGLARLRRMRAGGVAEELRMRFVLLVCERQSAKRD